MMRATAGGLRKAALGAAFFILGLNLPVQADATRDQALIAAAEKGDAAAVQQLLREGADVGARDGRGRSALLAATHGNRVEAARLLIAAGADVNAKDAIEDSAFLYAGAE